MFQHITTEIHNNEIIFFGRQENKKSIAVRIQNYKPHMIIKCSAPLAAVSAVLKTAVNERDGRFYTKKTSIDQKITKILKNYQKYHQNTMCQFFLSKSSTN